MHPGFRQYWRDFDSLEAFTGARQHQAWWRDFTRDSSDGGIWHETYRLHGGMAAIYSGVSGIGLASFAPERIPTGSFMSARQRVEAGVCRNRWGGVLSGNHVLTSRPGEAACPTFPSHRPLQPFHFRFSLSPLCLTVRALKHGSPCCRLTEERPLPGASVRSNGDVFWWRRCHGLPERGYRHGPTRPPASATRLPPAPASPVPTRAIAPARLVLPAR